MFISTINERETKCSNEIRDPIANKVDTLTWILCVIFQIYVKCLRAAKIMGSTDLSSSPKSLMRDTNRPTCR